jgi:tripartite ATP-independent transporter DctP family solute receptor
MWWRIDTPKGLAAEFFAKRAGELTKGKVKVEVYANSTLYKDKEEMEALQLGAVQMLAPSLAKFGPLGVKEFELFDLPYIFDNYAELHKVTQGPLGQTLLKKLEPKGVTGLAFWDNGFKSFSANTPIKMPADLKGKKMRIQSSKVLEEEIRALSALPQVMAFSEVYQALQTGVVDGTENPISNLYTQKMYRGAEASGADRAWLPGLCGDREQEVLGGSAGGRAWPTGNGDEGGDRVRQQDCQGAERQGSRRCQEDRQDAGLCADRRREVRPSRRRWRRCM